MVNRIGFAKNPSGGSGGGTTLLLDETGLGSAAAAYSVRKLRSAYAGSALRVRRSSDSTEQDIGFSGNDLDVASLETFCAATDGFVATWYDQSGNARNVTQSTASKQPKIVTSGSVITIGGKAAFLFDGVDDGLRTTFTLNQPETISAVMRTVTYSNNSYLWDGGSADGMAAIFRGGTDKYSLWAGSNGCTNTFAASATVLLTALYSGASSFLQVNNGSDATGNPGSNSAGGVTIGMYGNPIANFANIYAQEFVVWPVSLGSSERTAQRSNINTYFSIY